MTKHDLQIHCPVEQILQPDLSDFEPLLQRLRDAQPLSIDEAFPRGTLRADGRLDLCKQDAGVTGCAAVTRALQGSNLVHSLLLGTNGIGDEGAEHVAELVRTTPLRTVYLGCNLIGEAGVQALADAVRAQPEVRALWLKRNPIGPEGACLLADLLRENTTLRTLDVVHTGIGDDGARAILRALAEGNTTLEHLYLSGNALTPAILPELTAVLERHPNLRGLYLSVNRLGDEGACGLAELLPQSKLHTLGLASCGLSDAGTSQMLRAAWQTDLHFLDLGTAPSTRVLGASPNEGGDQTQATLAELVETLTHLKVLNLPRLPDPEAVVAALPAINVRIAGHASVGRRADLPPHPDALDIKSIYR